MIECYSPLLGLSGPFKTKAQVSSNCARCPAAPGDPNQCLLLSHSARLLVIRTTGPEIWLEEDSGVSLIQTRPGNPLKLNFGSFFAKIFLRWRWWWWWWFSSNCCVFVHFRWQWGFWAGPLTGKRLCLCFCQREDVFEAPPDVHAAVLCVLRGLALLSASKPKQLLCGGNSVSHVFVLDCSPTSPDLSPQNDPWPPTLTRGAAGANFSVFGLSWLWIQTYNSTILRRQTMKWNTLKKETNLNQNSQMYSDNFIFWLIHGISTSVYF